MRFSLNKIVLFNEGLFKVNKFWLNAIFPLLKSFWSIMYVTVSINLNSYHGWFEDRIFIHFHVTAVSLTSVFVPSL